MVLVIKKMIDEEKLEKFLEEQLRHWQEVQDMETVTSNKSENWIVADNFMNAYHKILKLIQEMKKDKTWMN